MARLRNGITGELSGKLGDLVFHQRYGRQFVRQRPESFLPGTDPESVGRRSRFALSVKLASAIYSIPELAHLWRQAAPRKKSVFNFIVGSNTNTVTVDSVTSNSVIVPQSDMRSVVTELVADCTGYSVSSDSIEIKLNSPRIASNSKNVEGKRGKLLSVMCMTKPVNASLPPSRIVAAASGTQQIVIDTTMVYTVPLNSSEGMYLASYQERKMLFTLVALDDKGNPVYYSATIVK